MGEWGGGGGRETGRQIECEDFSTPSQLGLFSPHPALKLYRKANHFLDAARLLFDLAEQAVQDKNNYLRAKKLYVLAALQVDAHHEQQKAGGVDATSSTLDGLLAEDSAPQMHSKMIDAAWRGAEGLHYFLLAQRQLYSGQYAASLRTAVRLVEYDDILDPVQVHSILALAAVANKSYGICSKVGKGGGMCPSERWPVSHHKNQLCCRPLSSSSRSDRSRRSSVSSTRTWPCRSSPSLFAGRGQCGVL